MPTIRIKKDGDLTEMEIDQIFDIYNEAFFNDTVVSLFNMEVLKCGLSQFNTFTWYMLIDDNENIIGIASLTHSFANAHLMDIDIEVGENIGSVAVKSEHRGKGYARLLMNELIKTCHDHGIRENDKLVLEVKKNNPHYSKVINLYKSLGFKLLVEKNEGIFLARDS